MKILPSLLTRSQSNSKRKIIKFWKINSLIIKTMITNQINTIYKMKKEVDCPNSFPKKITKLAIMTTPTNSKRTHHSNNARITETSTNRKLFRPTIPKVPAAGSQWTRKKGLSTGESITSKFKKDNREPAPTRST